jgi:polar amino acid transport system permease protein
LNYTFQFGVVLARWPEFLQGALITIELALAGFWLGAPFGLLFAWTRTSGPTWAKRIVGAYVIFITNIPVLIQVWFLYFGLPDLGILLDKYTCVILALVVATSAYTCEIMRAGFISVHRAEIEAAETLGFSRLHTVWYVVVPHIIRTIYPALANYFIVMTLSTSMAMIVGINELTGAALYIASENYRNLESITVAAGLYILITFAMSLSLALVGRWAFRVKARIL